jgi:hypothetical protein
VKLFAPGRKGAAQVRVPRPPTDYVAVRRSTVVRRVLATGVASLLAACDDNHASVPLPAPPLAVSADDPLGDMLSSAAGRLEAHLMGRIGDAYGKPQVRRYLLNDARAAAKLESWYRIRAAKSGWKRIDEAAGGWSRGEQAFGYEACGQALMIGWVEGGPQVPVISLRYGRLDRQCRAPIPSTGKLDDARRVNDRQLQGEHASSSERQQLGLIGCLLPVTLPLTQSKADACRLGRSGESDAVDPGLLDAIASDRDKGSARTRRNAS